MSDTYGQREHLGDVENRRRTLDMVEGKRMAATDHAGIVYLLVENTSAGRNRIGVFATLRDLDAYCAANPAAPNVIREAHGVALYGDVRRMAGPQRGREQT